MAAEAAVQIAEQTLLGLKAVSKQEQVFDTRGRPITKQKFGKAFAIATKALSEKRRYFFFSLFMCSNTVHIFYFTLYFGLFFCAVTWK